MKISRRQFLTYCMSSAAALSCSSLINQLEEILNPGGTVNSTTEVIWLNAANCTGCTVSLANLFSDDSPQDIADLLINYINLVFHPTLMGAAGGLAFKQIVKTMNKDFILVVEGGIPTAFNGHACMLWTDAAGNEITAMDAVNELAPMASAVVAVGTCSAFGGIPGAGSNAMGIKTVKQLTGIETINISGCPPHPDWIVWAIAHLLVGEKPALDGYGRPAELYNSTVHKQCSRPWMFPAHSFEDQGRCLRKLGCKGRHSTGDCPGRKWNNGTSWCIGANSICIGCTSKGFPDTRSPFFKENI